MNASAEVACISNWAGPLFIFKPFIYSPYVNMNVHSISRHLYYAVVKKKKKTVAIERSKLLNTRHSPKCSQLNFEQGPQISCTWLNIFKLWSGHQSFPSPVWIVLTLCVRKDVLTQLIVCLQFIAKERHQSTRRFCLLTSICWETRLLASAMFDFNNLSAGIVK